MPQHPGFVIGPKLAGKLARLVSMLDRGLLGPIEGESNEFWPTSGPNIAYATAGPAVAGWPAGYHEATIDYYDQESGDWFEDTTPAMLYELNGKALVEGDRYACTYHETVKNPAGDAAAVFSCNLGGDSPSAAQMVVLKIVSVLSANRFSAVTATHNGTSWTYGAEVRAFEINGYGSEITAGTHFLGVKVGTLSGYPFYGIQLDPYAVTDVTCDSTTLLRTKRGE